MGRPVHSGLILPGDVASSGGRLTIHVPRGYETEHDRMADPAAGGYHVCRVLVAAATGEICGRVFDLDREGDYDRHRTDCAAQHIDEIRAGSPRARMPILDPASWDPEIDEHMRKLGERMKRERRLEVKPSERAGFS